MRVNESFYSPIDSLCQIGSIYNVIRAPQRILDHVGAAGLIDGEPTILNAMAPISDVGR
jgi:hypothetical protein